MAEADPYARFAPGQPAADDPYAKFAPGYVAPVEKPRGLLAVANDTVIEAANAVAGSFGAAANFVAPGNAVSKFIDEKIIRPGEASQSDVAQASRKRFQDEVEAADGVGDELLAVGRKVLDAPLLTAAQAVGSFAIPGIAVKGAGALAGGARAANASAAGASRVANAGLAGGAVAGGALAGGDAAGTAYDLVIQAGGSDEQATEAARRASVIPAAIGAAGGVIGAERLLAGASHAKGGMLARGLKTGAIEGLQEGIEEGVTNYEGRRAAVPFDPAIDPMKGTAAAAGLGAVMGGGIGTAIGMLSSPAQKPKPDPVQAILAAPSIDAALEEFNATAAPAERAKGPDPVMAEIRRLLDPADQSEAVGLLATSNDGNVVPHVRRWAQNRLDELLHVPTGEATEVAPVEPIPAGEATEVVPAGEALELPARIPVGDAAELIPTGEATVLPRRIPTGQATEMPGPAPNARAPRRNTDALPLDLAGAPNAVAAYVQRMASTATPAARAFVQDYRAGRITNDDVLGLLVKSKPVEPTADERLAAAAAQAQPILPTDLLTGDGQPYGSKTAANIRAKREGGTIVPVTGGWVVRTEQANVEPVVPVSAGVPVPAPDAGGDQRGGSVGVVGPVAAAGGAGVVQPGGPAPAASGVAPELDAQGRDGGGDAALSAPGGTVMPAGLNVTFGGKTYPVESINDAQEKWIAFRDETGEGVSKVGNGIRITDGAGRFVARISYNGRVWDGEDTARGGGKVIAESPDGGITKGRGVTKKFMEAGALAFKKGWPRNPPPSMGDGDTAPADWLAGYDAEKAKVPQALSAPADPTANPTALEGRTFTMDGKQWTVDAAGPRYITIVGPDGKEQVISDGNHKWPAVRAALGLGKPGKAAQPAPVQPVQPVQPGAAVSQPGAADGKSRAAVGGQDGINGYFYKGGQFLPSTMAEPGKWKIKGKWVSAGKAEVAPGEWAHQPTPFSRSIFSLVGGWATKDGAGRIRLFEGAGGKGIRDSQWTPITLDTEIRPGVKGVLGKQSLTVRELIDAYNAGQRWFDVQPDAETVTTAAPAAAQPAPAAPSDGTSAPAAPAPATTTTTPEKRQPTLMDKMTADAGGPVTFGDLKRADAQAAGDAANESSDYPERWAASGWASGALEARTRWLERAGVKEGSDAFERAIEAPWNKLSAGVKARVLDAQRDEDRGTRKPAPAPAAPANAQQAPPATPSLPEKVKAKRQSEAAAEAQQPAADAESAAAPTAAAPSNDAAADPFSGDYEALAGKTVEQKITLDDGRVATMRVDAAVAMRSADSRLNALRGLRACLGRGAA